ncbi:MAG: M28 family peptidase [Gemmatimonadota bacterium]
MLRGCVLVLGGVLGASGALHAQARAASGTFGAATITPEDFRRRIWVLAHDSMRGRDTPSPELVETAEYVAREFRSFGVKPGAGDGYLQRFPLTAVRPGAREAQRLRLRGPNGEFTLRAGDDFVPGQGVGVAEGSGPLIGVSATGGLDAATGKIAVLNVGRGGLFRSFQNLGEALRRHRPAGLILVLDVEDQFFRQVGAFLSTSRVTLGEPAEPGPPVVFARRSAVPAALRGSDAPPDLSGWTGELRTESAVERAEGLNTIGVLEGSDPNLRNEYVIFTAHMDHEGVGRPDASGDSIYNGADDDASGTATVVELAQAFASLPTPPRRSLIFMTVSGEEKGLLGSRWYSEHPAFPLERTVANINIDMVGRNWRDTIVAIGKEESTLGAVAERVAAEHPELDMAVIDDLWPNERFYFRSDHYNFARKGVPILFFFNGTHEDYHRPSDEPDRIEYEKISRIGKLLFYLGLEIANADARPEWTPEAYRRVVEGAGE